MKRLSMRSATRCETAKNARCRCRCGGLLHGAKRSEDAAYFEALPDEDPHKAKAKRQPTKRVLKRDCPLPLFEGAA